MRSSTVVFLFLPLLLLSAALCNAQCTSGDSMCIPVPRLVKLNGALKDGSGHPRTGTVGAIFSVYRDSSGGTPLWQETQNVQLDQKGHYEVLLGAASQGVPLDLFVSGEPRWLGMQVQLQGEEEQPRVLLVSVPYALKASDAETLGGLPPSAFVKVTPSTASGQNAPNLNTALAAPSQVPNVSPAALGTVSAPSIQPVTTPGGTPYSIPLFSAASSIVSSPIGVANGVVSVPNLSNILFAETFPNGVPDAVAACPAKGCVIYAVSPKVNLNLGTIDPGAKAVTIYLGPFTYTVKQVTLRDGLRLIGMGASGPADKADPCVSACTGTTLQSVNGNSPVFVIPQSNGSPAIDVLMSGFRLVGSIGNTSEDAILLDASSLSNAGLWYSTLKDIQIFNFAGVGVHLKGTTNGFEAMSQWVRFDKVVVFRTPGGANALRIEGAAFELHFEDCQFDGRAKGDGTNIYIGAVASGTMANPISITFQGLVSQLAGTAVHIDGAQGISFYASHHEKLWGAYQITGANFISNIGVTISDTWFNSDVGVNGGAGFLLNVATPNASGIRFIHNQIFGSPDSAVSGTNSAQIVYQDNDYEGYYHGSSNLPPTSGITTQVGPAASINIGGAHSVGLNPSTTPIQTIQSSLGPGEMVTFFTFDGPATFASGGNINLMGQSTLTVNGSMTFVRNDLVSLAWIPVAQWTAP
jgi:hypothetical protein